MASSATDHDQPSTGGVGESGESPGQRHGPEWQPWDASSKWIFLFALVAIAGLIVVFVALSFNH